MAETGNKQGLAGARSFAAAAAGRHRPAPRARTERTNPTASDAWLIARVALMIVLAWWIYAPALNGGWLWDDRRMIAENPLVLSPGGLLKLWAGPAQLFDYLTVKVEWLQWRAWGEDTLGYHLVNLALHLTSAFLFWRLLTRFGLHHAWLGALLMVVHPVMVESVAWMAELKNTLSLPFALMAFLAWLDFDKSSRWSRYTLALGFFLLAMLAKPMLVMFPFVTLLYAWWKRGRVDLRDVLLAAPFLVLSVALGAATVMFVDRALGPQHVALGGPLARLALAGTTLAFYFAKSVAPINLMTIYPKWSVDGLFVWPIVSWLLVAVAVVYLVRNRATWGRHGLLGLGFFAFNLLPFLGFVAGSYMKDTWVMDHLLYLPILGIFGLATAAVAGIEASLGTWGRRAGAGVLVMLFGLLAVASHAYAANYASAEFLWRYNIARNPVAALPHNDLAYALEHQGRLREAAQEYRRAVDLDPEFFTARHNFGSFLLQHGQPQAAFEQLRAAAELNPTLASARYDFGTVLDALQRLPDAIQAYRQALALDPNYTLARNNLAVDLAKDGRLDEAIAEIREGLHRAPGDKRLKYNLGLMLQTQQQHAAPAPVAAPAPSTTSR
jgi:tetratricopeptide (TPR) repeat protein